MSRKVQLATLTLIVWLVSPSTPVRADDAEPIPAVETATNAGRQLEIETGNENARPEGLLAHGGSGPPEQTERCDSDGDHAAIQEAIERYLKVHGAFAPASPAAPSKFPFYPMGGRLYRDLFTVNFNDLDISSPGILDWDCTDFTYDGHDATDVDLRTFTEQEIGVPIFAALDGEVIDTHDGEPDHNTTQPNVISNYVVIDHGAGRICSYLHMRLNSVMVSPGQIVKAGQQIGFTASSGRSSGPHLHFSTYDLGNRLEPYTGPCNPGESQWVDQTPILRDMYLRDFNVSDADLGAFPGLPFDMPRTGTFVQGFRDVYFWINLMNIPAGSTWRVRFQRPDLTIAFDSGANGFGNPFYRWSWWWWSFGVNLNVTGTWHILLDINGQTLATAPLEVVASAGTCIGGTNPGASCTSNANCPGGRCSLNRSPNPITVALDPATPTVSDTIFCLVDTDLVLDDRDYDVVRYHFVWKVDGDIVRDLISAGQADALPHHTATPDSLVECIVTPTDSKDDGPTVTASAVLDVVSKFDQPPDGTGEAIASNLDWTDLSPNLVAADDFLSDGRPITGVRWWGSEIAPPTPDGWLISFHEPLTTGGVAELPLGLYFCDPGVVAVSPKALAACDALPVSEYEVILEDCCLIHASVDSRNSQIPAQADAFNEQLCFEYDLDIQAVVGHRFVGSGASCTEEPTGNTATMPFWGWHTTGMERGMRGALLTGVSMSGPDWLYGPWSPITLACSAPNMAFQLLTNQNPTTGDCNENGTPDVCESGPDCQPNGVLDECDIAGGTSKDCNGSGIPDECEIDADPDCNSNAILDTCDSVRVGSLTSVRPAVLGFVDISGMGVPLNLGDDGAASVTMPFTAAAFSGSTLSVANNGGAGTVPGTILGAVANAPLPSAVAFGGNEAMLPHWDDLHETTGNVYYHTVGVSPNQTFIVQWDDLEHFNLADGTLDGDEVTFQLQVFETPVGGVIAQYLYADTDFRNAGFNNGASATVGYQRSSTSALQWSFNTAEAVTPGVVLSLLRSDLNGNGVPDPCDPPGVINWDSSETSADRNTRSLRFKVAGTSPLDAIRVTQIDLQHPDPRNLPQYPPANFSTFDTGTHGTCAGGDFAGHHCDDNADCLRNMPAGVDGTCTLPGPACTAEGAASNSNFNQGSCARWVGRPGTFYETQGPPLAGPYRAARLQCTPFYWDWVTETAVDPIVVVGAEILPSSRYSVQVYATSCMGAEAGCTNVSAAMTMYTRRSGDVDMDYNPPSATNQPNAIDVAQVVNKFKNIAGAPIHAQAQLQPNLPELNASVNALDIVAVVDSVKGFAYTFSGPCPCPSLVTCGGTCTGCAGMCVKTCAGGDNAGGPCINDNHCPGGGVCGTPGICNGGSRNGLACGAPANCPGGGCNVGYCRDACGRCKP